MSGRDYYEGGDQGESGYGQQGGGYGNQQGQGRQEGGYGGQQGNSRPSEGGFGRQEAYYSQGGSYGNQQGQGRQEGGYGGQQGGYAGGNAPQGGNYGGGGGYGNGGDDDLQGAARHANEHAGSSGDSDFFSNILGRFAGNKESIGQQPIDEQHAVQSHQQFYGNNSGSGQQASSGSMGSAAAMQALKMFTGGSSGGSQQGNSQNAFIGMAMGQASKLFDSQASQGNVASGASKESAVQQAGEMALKMYMQSQGNSSGLMGLASKFL